MASDAPRTKPRTGPRMEPGLVAVRLVAVGLVTAGLDWATTECGGGRAGAVEIGNVLVR